MVIHILIIIPHLKLLCLIPHLFCFPNCKWTEVLSEHLIKLDVSYTKIDVAKLNELKSMKRLQLLRGKDQENLRETELQIAKPKPISAIDADGHPVNAMESLWNMSIKQLDIFEDVVPEVWGNESAGSDVSGDEYELEWNEVMMAVM